MKSKDVKSSPAKTGWSPLKITLGLILFLGFAGAIGGTWFLKVEQNKSRRYFESLTEEIEASALAMYRMQSHDISHRKLALLEKVEILETELKTDRFQDHAWARAHLGRAYTALGMKEKARDYLFIAEGNGFRDPKLTRSLACFVFAGLILDEEQNQNQTLQGKISQELSLKENDPDAAIIRVTRLLSSRKYDNVLEMTGSLQDPSRTWLVSGIEAAAYCGLGDAKKRKGRLESAQVEYRLAVLVTEKMAQSQPSNPLSHLMAAHLYFRMHQTELMESGQNMPNYLDAAMGSIRAAMMLEPDNARAADLYRKIQKLQADAVN